MKTPRLLQESHIQQTVTEFLQLDGWHAIRTDPVSDRKRGKGFGELGMPDYLFIRYWPTFRGAPDIRLSTDETIAQVLWIEFKAPGKKPKAHQLAWHEAERKRGALVLVADDIDKFIGWYYNSGLKRR